MQVVAATAPQSVACLRVAVAARAATSRACRLAIPRPSVQQLTALAIRVRSWPCRPEQVLGRFPALTVSIHSEEKSVQVAEPRLDRVFRWAAPAPRRGCSALGGQAELGLRSGACPPDAVLARRAAHPVYTSDARTLARGERGAMRIYATAAEMRRGHDVR